jgi:hypothetical protein
MVPEGQDGGHKRGNYDNDRHCLPTVTVIVIDHNPRWSDSDRKNKEKFWMHRLKSFHPNGMNKINDFTRMNMG